jgi:hypothetical protein
MNIPRHIVAKAKAFGSSAAPYPVAALVLLRYSLATLFIHGDSDRQTGAQKS